MSRAVIKDAVPAVVLVLVASAVVGGAIRFGLRGSVIGVAALAILLVADRIASDYARRRTARRLVSSNRHLRLERDDVTTSGSGAVPRHIDRYNAVGAVDQTDRPAVADRISSWPTSHLVLAGLGPSADALDSSQRERLARALSDDRTRFGVVFAWGLAALTTRSTRAERHDSTSPAMARPAANRLFRERAQAWLDHATADEPRVLFCHDVFSPSGDPARGYACLEPSDHAWIVTLGHSNLNRLASVEQCDALAIHAGHLPGCSTIDVICAPPEARQVTERLSELGIAPRDITLSDGDTDVSRLGRLDWFQRDDPRRQIHRRSALRVADLGRSFRLTGRPLARTCSRLLPSAGNALPDALVRISSPKSPSASAALERPADVRQESESMHVVQTPESIGSRASGPVGGSRGLGSPLIDLTPGGDPETQDAPGHGHSASEQSAQPRHRSTAHRPLV